MPTFITPVVDGRMVGDDTKPSWRYFQYQGAWATHVTVWANRTLVTPAVNALSVPGDGLATAPDAAHLDITGDIDVRVRLAMDNWQAPFTSIFNKWTAAGGQQSWFMQMNNGFVNLRVFDGSVQTNRASLEPVPFVDGEAGWIRATLDVDNGAAGRDYSFFTSVDGETWTPMGAPVTVAGTTPIFASTSIIRLGGRDNGAEDLSGRVFAAELRNGIDGTIVANPDFRSLPVSTTAFSDAQGNAWTVAAPAAVVEAVPAEFDTVWHDSMTPYAGGATYTVHDALTGTSTYTEPDDGIATAQVVYEGNGVHQITDAEAAELVAAGYGDGIDIAPLDLVWTADQAGVFTSTATMSTDAPSAVVVGEGTVTDSQITWRATGGASGASNVREFHLLDGTTGWTDVDVHCDGINPPHFGTDYQGTGINVLPQMGVCLRYEIDGGVHRGISINNNIAFGLPLLNVGVWQSNLDGSNFQHRESGWPFFDSLWVPYGFHCRLVGSVATVEIFPIGHHNANPGDPTKTRVIDLDTVGDTVSIPTPTEGQCGFTVAHLGLNPYSAVRLGHTTFRRI